MVKDASRYEAEDQKKKALVETKNMLDSLIHQTKKMKETMTDKLEPNDIEAIDAAIASAESSLSSETKAELDEAHANLNNVVQQIAKQAYESTATPTQDADPASAGDFSANNDDGIIDAEYV